VENERKQANERNEERTSITEATRSVVEEEKRITTPAGVPKRLGETKGKQADPPMSLAPFARFQDKDKGVVPWSCGGNESPCCLCVGVFWREIGTKKAKQTFLCDHGALRLVAALLFPSWGPTHALN
jgi:hypothetical protein